MNVWLVLLLGGLLTFGMRYSFIYLLGKYDPPEMFRRALRYVPPAILSAIIVPELFFRAGQIYVSPMNFRLLAGISAIVVAFKTRNTLLTILCGMAVLLILEYCL